MPEIQNNFQHILQFEDNQNFDILLDQPILRKRRGRPFGKRNRQDSWKNTATPEWKPTQKFELPWDPDTIATRTRSKNDVNCVHPNVPVHCNDHELGVSQNKWSIVDYRRTKPQGAPNHI